MRPAFVMSVKANGTEGGHVGRALSVDKVGNSDVSQRPRDEKSGYGRT